MTVNLEDFSSDELHDLRSDINRVLEQRAVVDDARRQIDRIAERVLRAAGESPGGTWKQPTGAHDVYPLGWQVEHEGKTWVSLVHANSWEPGVSGWREVTEGIPEWVQPTGTHDAYSSDFMVTWKGAFWRSLVEDNVWEPGVSGWVEVDEEGVEVPSEPEPEPEEPTDPETPDPEPEEPSYPDFEQPEGERNYSTGDRVRFGGQVYESLIDNNVWSPLDYPQGWKLVED